MGKLAHRNKFQMQLYNCRRLLRQRAEKIGSIKDDQAIGVVEMMIAFEQKLFRIEIGLRQADAPMEATNGAGSTITE